MIVKLTRSGGITRYVEAAQIFEQSVAFGRIDLEIITPTGGRHRLLVGEFDEAQDTDMAYHRAYVLDHGVTLDTIKGHSPPLSVTTSRANTITESTISFRVPAPTGNVTFAPETFKQASKRKKRK